MTALLPNISNFSTNGFNAVKFFMCKDIYCMYVEKKENKDIELNNENCMSCDLCNEEFKGSCALKSHIARDHPQTNAMIADQKKAFTLCVLCSATFNSRVELRKHKKSEHKDQEFPCPQCNWTGDTPNSLQNHRTNVCRARGVY